MRTGAASSLKEDKTLLILAFETSAKAVSVALHDGARLLAQSYQNTGLTHSQTLMSMARDLLANCGKTAADVTALAVAAGPGSFTGVRIGVAAAKGFGWGAQLEVYGVSTLESMALALGAYEGYVCACMDARRSQVYNAVFKARGGELERICEDRAIALADLEKELLELEGPVYLVGDGSVLCYDSLSQRVATLVLPPEHRMHQQAVGVALAALKAIQRGERGDGARLTPNYLRLSQAERERLEKENKGV